MTKNVTPAVIFLCTGNSCRSILAESLWHEESRGSWKCASAGTRPTGIPHPLALKVLEEEGVSVSDIKSQGIEEFSGVNFDLAVTVCHSANEECPAFPGATRTLHWPFPDPAEHVAIDDESPEGMQIFRVAREAIRQRIQRYLATLDFKAALFEILDQLPGEIPEERRVAYRSLVQSCGEAMDQVEAWAILPKIIHDEMKSFGWLWNGFYHLKGQVPNRRLILGEAAGPPVCATIEENPGQRSGMCFDAVQQGGILVAADVNRWPGYVSCDGESGLNTVSSIVRPIFDENGDVVAVWDLDSSEEIHPCDALVMDALLEGFGAFGHPVEKSS